MPDFSWIQWLAAAIGAVCIGIAKTGVPGFGIFAVPVFALVVDDAVGSAGWLVPLLIAADCFAVAYHRRHAQMDKLFTMLPWVFVGMVVGYFAMAADRRWLHGTAWSQASRIGIGLIILAMVVLHVWRRIRAAPVHPGTRAAATYGLTAGFTSFLANAAGPIMNLYFLAKRFPKEQLIGTGAWFFLIVNTSKVPFYAQQGLFSRESLIFDLILLPGVVLGALFGRRIFDLLPQRFFENLVLVLAAAAALLMVVPKSLWQPGAKSAEAALPTTGPTGGPAPIPIPTSGSPADPEAQPPAADH